MPKGLFRASFAEACGSERKTDATPGFKTRGVMLDHQLRGFLAEHEACWMKESPKEAGHVRRCTMSTAPR